MSSATVQINVVPKRLLTPQDEIAAHEGSFVYIIEIGKRHVKIGFTTNLAKRFKAFETSALGVNLVLAIPGERGLEKKLHKLLSEQHFAREIFEYEWRIDSFVRYVKDYGLDRGLCFLEETSPQRRAEIQKEQRDNRLLTVRLKKAEQDAYFASLVSERKNRLGW
jgi:hypothetical protein